MGDKSSLPASTGCGILPGAVPALILSSIPRSSPAACSQPLLGGTECFCPSCSIFHCYVLPKYQSTTGTPWTFSRPYHQPAAVPSSTGAALSLLCFPTDMKEAFAPKFHHVTHC